MAEFQLEGFTQRGSQLLARTRGVFDRYRDLIDKSSTLPTTMQPSDGAVKLVFVGQYSSGKSSLIKMLSGIDTKIGAAITTDKATAYPWGDLEIVDTPGIETGLRADHDERAYYEIDRAALLIFVVTNEGFDGYMGNHFRKLAVDQKRGKNMVLVVNKMDRAPLGNVPEQQKVIADDLRKVIAPYSTDDLYLSFVAAEMYLEGLNESDSELRDIYFEQSGRDRFVENLNAFVASRGVLSKVRAPLETLRKSITGVIGDSGKMIDDTDLDAVEEILRRKRQEINEGKRRIKNTIERLAETCANKIRAEGSTLASEIEPGLSEEELNKRLERAQQRSDEYIKNCERAIVEQIKSVCAEVDGNLDKIDRSNLAISVRRKLNVPTVVDGTLDSVKIDIDAASAVSRAATTAKAASKMSVGIPLLGEIKFASVVKDVGHMFGMKFAPWGAVNLVKGASKALGYIGMAITAYQILDKIFGTDKEQEMRDNLLKAKNSVRDDFDDGARRVQENLVEWAMTSTENLTGPIVRGAEETYENFKARKDRLKALNHELQPILVDVDALMDEVQAALQIR